MAALHPVQVGYAATFGLATVSCFVASYRARRIEHRDTRRGLIGLLTLVGLWAGFETARLLVSSAEAKVAFYLLGLIVGLAAGGAWLYFASAYAGYDLHRNPTYRRIAMVTFVAIVALKLTNPLHGRYFTARLVEAPFPHLVIDQGLLHWATTGLIYVLAGVGFYMLFQLFIDSHVSTRSLGFVVSLAGLPVVLDLLGNWGVAGLLELNYEPLGVAAFGIGVLYFVEESFVAVQGFGRQQIVDRLSEAVVLTDAEDIVRDWNRQAEALFPVLAGSEGVPLTEVLPEVAAVRPGHDEAGDALASDEWTVVSVHRDGDLRYFLSRETPLTIGPHRLGRAFVFADVTQLEHQRQELERQNEQLDGFAAAVAHELRNGISIVAGSLETAAQELETSDPEAALASIQTARERSTRLVRVIGDLTKLARYSQTVGDLPVHDYRSLAGDCLAQLDTGELAVTVRGAGELRAEQSRFTELLRNAVLFAELNDAGGLTVAPAPDGFELVVEDLDLSAADPTGLFEYGTAEPNAESGMLTANMQTLARAHGWEISADVGGQTVRFTVSGVEGSLTDEDGASRPP